MKRQIAKWNWIDWLGFIPVLIALTCLFLTGCQSRLSKAADAYYRNSEEIRHAF
jgi:hypothetical protein